MNFLQRRINVEQIISAVRAGGPEADLRSRIYDLVDEQRAEATREVGIIANALVAMQGGTVEMPAEVFGHVGPNGALEFSLHHDGRVTLKTTELPVALLEAVRAAHARTGTVVPVIGQVPSPASDYPAANIEEPENVARIRVLNAIRTLVQRHYDGELRARGLNFMVTVAGELLAMALGTELAHQDDPNEGAALAVLVNQLAPRLNHYHDVVRQQLEQQQPEPGDSAPPAPSSSRVM